MFGFQRGTIVDEQFAIEYKVEGSWIRLVEQYPTLEEAQYALSQDQHYPHRIIRRLTLDRVE